MTLRNASSALPTAGWVLALLAASYSVIASPGAMRHNADSLIGVFVSLESWTLFYWGQDRFGMLLPAAIAGALRA